MAEQRSKVSVPRPKLVGRNRRTHWISPKLALRLRKDKGGYGVYATQPLQSGELLVMWGGDIVPGELLSELTDTARRHSVQVEENLFLAPHQLPEPGDFVNHSCDPNSGLSGQMSLVSLRKISAGEEVCYDYAMSDGSPYDEFICQCGSWNCRGRVTGNDWMLPELQRRYSGCFSPYLQRRIDESRGNSTPVHLVIVEEAPHFLASPDT